MLFNLVKKDFLLIKKHVIFMLLISFIIPLFILWKIPMLLGGVAFFFTIVYVELLLIQPILLVETKYPKATTLLCSTPITRKSIVEAKYIYFGVVFIFCYISYSILALFIEEIQYLSPLSVIISFMLISIIFNAYMPIQYKFGFESTKYFFVIVIFTISFGLPSIMTIIPESFTFDMNMPTVFKYLLPIILTIISTIISMKMSIKIFQQQEL